MFSIYGLTGPVFRGSLQQLGSAPGIAAVRRVGAVGPIDALTAPVLPDSLPEARAINAYRQALDSDIERGPLYHASQIMQRKVITLAATDDVATAWQLLLARHIHQAPVLDADMRLVGLVSERNLLTALNVEDGRIRDAMARKVGDVMVSPVVAAAPVTDIRRIATAMLDYGVDGVPIVDEAQELVGFISRGDVLRAVVTDPPLSLWR